MDRSVSAHRRELALVRARGGAAASVGVPLRPQAADELRGALPAGPGHAGRRIAALGLALVALVALLLSATAQLAQAASIPSTITIGAVSREMGDSGFHDVMMWRAEDHSPVFCADKSLLEPPSGSTLTGGRWTGSLMMDYVLYHGFEGPIHGFEDQSSLFIVTKCCVWAIREAGEDGALGWIDDNVGGNEAMKELLRKAKAFKDSGGNGPERGTSAIYSSGSSSTQDVVWFAGSRTGKVALAKTSTLTDLTKDNPCYGFAGIEYGIYDSPTDFSASHLKGVIKLDASGKGTSVDLPAGTYYLREGFTTGSGFAWSDKVTKAEVASGATAEVSAADAPQGLLEWELVAKRDSKLGAKAQGDATLAGAVFEIAYYANLDGNTSGTPRRTWQLESDSSGLVCSKTAHLVGGDALYELDGKPFLPLGTYLIKEHAAPAGYVLSDSSSRTIVLKPTGKGAASAAWSGSATWGADGPEGRGVADDVVRGGIKLGKVDAENGRHLPSGTATLKGAEFSIENASAENVVVNGTSYAPGQIVMTLETDEEGIAQTAEDALPFGTYHVRETRPPKGYLPNKAWERVVEIRKPGIVDCSGEVSSVADRVVRGDLRFNKVEAGTMERLPGTVFKIESLTTGESHLIVADENGVVDTSRNAHSQSTNANDAALAADGSLDESKLSDSAGIYFSGRADLEVAPRDSFGALPYDSYRIEELRSSANEGLKLVSFTVHVHAEKVVVDMGTADDEVGTAIGTTLTSQAGGHMVPAHGTVYLTDVIRYEGLERNAQYQVRGALMDGATGEDLGIEAEASFTARTSSGEVSVCFEVDAEAVAGMRLVAFEELWLEGKLVAEHKDLEDGDQSVWVPSIGTTLTGEEGEKVLGAAEGTVTLVDTVAYEGLEPGRSYVVTGRLMDKSTGEDLGITGTTNLIPDQSVGTCVVSFEVEASRLVGKKVVAFENVTLQGVEVAVHADIEDEAQTVTFEEPDTPPENPPDTPPSTPGKKLLPKTGDEVLPYVAVGAGGIVVAGLALGVRAATRRRRPKEPTVY